MKSSPFPVNEDERLSALKELFILDTPAETLFDEITQLANVLCNTSIAFISLIDEDRQWFKSCIGLSDVVETPRDIAFCAYTILESEVLEVNDSTLDDRFKDNPLVINYPNIRFYAGAPIILPNQQNVGTLSVISTRPGHLSKAQKKLLKAMAQYIATMLIHRKQSISENFNHSNILAAIVESSDDAIVGKDLNSIITAWNKGAERVFGYNAEEMIGKPITKLFPRDKLDEEAIFMASIKAGKSIAHYETSRLTKNGSLIEVSVSMSPIMDVSGTIIGASKIARDITSRKVSERRITQLGKMYQALSEVNHAIVRLEHQDELFPLVCKCAVEFGGMDLAFIVQVDSSGNEFSKVACYGKNQQYFEDIIISPDVNHPYGQGPTGITFRENKHVVVQQFLLDELTQHWSGLARNNNWHSSGSFPINKGNKSFAVLNVYSTQCNFFTEEIISLLDEMTMDISFALDNFDRESKRLAAEESLMLAASVFDASSEGIMITDPENTIIAVNPAFSEITGYQSKDVLGRKPSVLKSGNHNNDFYKEMWKDIIESGTWEGEIWDKRKSGEIYPQVQRIKTLYNDDGSVKRRIAIFSDNSQKRESEFKIWRQANFDFLTELPNRKMFYERLEQEIQKSTVTLQNFALLLVDIDQFKEVNDALGHDVGDLLLKEVAGRLKESVINVDNVARLGGDEFTIILTDTSHSQGLDSIVSNLLKRLAEPYLLSNDVIYSSVSIGVAISPEHGLTVESLLKNADQALFSAKRNGRNCYSIFTERMQQAMQRKVQIAKDLRNAIHNKEISLAYQPIVNLKTGTIHKAEVLVRWHHPSLGNISPAEFIPIAEDTGFINEIGLWVIEESILQLKKWIEHSQGEFQLSINMSPVQFRKGDFFNNTINELIKKSGLNGKNLAIEITEGLLLDSEPIVKETLLRFRDAGIQVSIDDFGTGYSALSYIKKFDIDYLKIDKSFVDNITENKDDISLCEAIVEMAHKLGIKVIAEGVETDEQKEILGRMNCDFGQGYLWSKPIDELSFENLFLND